MTSAEGQRGAGSIAGEALKAGRGGPPVAVATVIAGPAQGQPRAGAKLLVRADGSRLGSFGPIEETVAEDCLTALTRVPREAIQALYYRPEGVDLQRRQVSGG